MLAFEGAAKRFGPVTAPDGCTFAARPGRLTGFLGPNGAGLSLGLPGLSRQHQTLLSDPGQADGQS
jgi:ABC-type Na+ transport system ATPase subunit NatA